MQKKTRFIVLVVVAIKLLLMLALLMPRLGHAQDLPSERAGASRAADLETQLALYAEHQRSARRAFGLTGLVAGALLVPAGAALITRDGTLPRQIGVGLVGAGAVPLLFSAQALRPGHLERIAAAFSDELDRGDDPTGAAQRAEAAWQQAATNARDDRHRRGALYTTLGVLSTAAGLALMLTPAGSLGLAGDKHYMLGSALLAPGVPFLGIGIRELMVPSLEETSWQSYAAGRAIKDGRVGLMVGARTAGLSVALTF